MDYEQKYKEALNWMRSIYPTLTGSDKEDAEHYFPELHESEDERIRRWIIDFAKGQIDGYMLVDDNESHKIAGIWKEAIAYLEKQKEQKDLFKDGVGHYFYDGDKVHFCSAPAMEVRELDDSNEPVEHRQHVREIDLEKEKAIEILKDYLKWAINPDEECKYTWKELTDAIRLGISAMKEQKPNIELIQKSWYMEGYHDREFNKEPKWIIKTGEGGPRYEENPKYGQIIEQKPEQYDIDVLEKHITKDSVSELAHTVIVRNGWEIVEKEQKPAEWSEYDESYLQTVINEMEANKKEAREYEHKKYDTIISWLKSLRSQPKQEWSEEDKLMIKCCLAAVKCYENTAIRGDYLPVQFCIDGYLTTPEKVAGWLRSLCNRPKSSDNWKPSEEQMKALNALNCHGDLSFVGQQNQLISLYNDLKKLI